MLFRILQAISSAVPSVVSSGAYCQMSRLISNFKSLCRSLFIAGLTDFNPDSNGFSVSMSFVVVMVTNTSQF